MTLENEKTKYWTCPVNEDGILQIPDELWEGLGWIEGDELELIDQEDGSFLLIKIDDTERAEAKVGSPTES